jgi:AbrB family looped-hinge helix DNA binding protein
MATVKNQRRRGHTRISAKNQVTIPVEILKETGLKPGDELRVQADGTGRVTFTRTKDLVARHAGTLSYPKGYLKKLRSEWRY